MVFVMVAAAVTGLAVTAPPAQAAPGNILPPFNVGEQWWICQGYNTTLTHNGTSAYGLDLVGGPACDNSASGRTVRAPLGGTVVYYQAAYGNLCVNVAGGRSYTLTHINSGITGGSITAGQAVGTVAAAGQRSNNGVAHIHFQMWSTANCYSSSGIPFDSAHSARICGAPDLTVSGPSGGNGVWSGTSFVGESCDDSTTQNRISLLNSVGEVWAKDTLSFGGWAQQTGPSSAKSIEAGGSTQVLIDLCGAVWAKDTLSYGDWTQEAGCDSAKSVVVSSTGTQAILDFCGAVWTKTSIGNGGWAQEASCGAAASISVGGSSISLVNGCGAIWAKPAITGSTSGWNQQTECNSAKSVALSDNGLQMLIDLCDSVWAKSSIISGGWVQETGCGSATSVSTGRNTQTILDFCGAIYSKTGIDYGNWSKEADCDSAKSMVVSSTGRRIIMGLDNSIWAKEDSIAYGGWGQQAGSSSAIMIAAG